MALQLDGSRAGSGAFGSTSGDGFDLLFGALQQACIADCCCRVCLVGSQLLRIYSNNVFCFVTLHLASAAFSSVVISSVTIYAKGVAEYVSD